MEALSRRHPVVPEHAHVEMIDFRIDRVALHRDAGQTLLARPPKRTLRIVVQQASRKRLACTVPSDDLNRAVEFGDKTADHRDPGRDSAERRYWWAIAIPWRPRRSQIQASATNDRSARRGIGEVRARTVPPCRKKSIHRQPPTDPIADWQPNEKRQIYLPLEIVVVAKRNNGGFQCKPIRAGNDHDSHIGVVARAGGFDVTPPVRDHRS